jgi:hypothetical protein
MSIGRFTRGITSGALILALAACSGGGKGWFGDKAAQTREDREMAGTGMGTSLRDLLGGGANPNTTVEVNKYIWNASLDVLSFLPIESVDPFTGVIVTGYGTPPGGGRAYRATIYVQDPALDARSLRIAMQTKGGGAVAPETVHAVEDAILTRARQLRVQDGKL